MTINIYDNRYHDDECTLVVDASNPGTIAETSLTNGQENWAVFWSRTGISRSGLPMARISASPRRSPFS